MPFPSIPGEQDVRETVVSEPRHRQDSGITEERCEPTFAGCCPPDCDHHIRANQESTGFIGRVQAATHIIERGAIGSQRIRFIIDITK